MSLSGRVTLWVGQNVFKNELRADHLVEHKVLVGVSIGIAVLVLVVAWVFLIPSLSQDDAAPSGTPAPAAARQQRADVELLPGECPVLNLPAERTGGSAVMAGAATGMSIDAWQFVGIMDDGTVLPAESYAPLLCRKGSERGETVSFYYCGSSQPGWRAFIKRTIIDNEGTIVGVERKEFTIEYDQNLQYVATRCGATVDEHGRRV